MFIDALRFELAGSVDPSFKAVLKDDKGSICSTFETILPASQKELTWRGLDELPYGVYTLELSHGNDNMNMRLVKRI
jgi:hypothetical protein